MRHEDPEMMAIEKEFSSVFHDDLPDGLPPKRNIDHQIEIRVDAKPPHKPIFQLSPAELLATKEYVTELLKKGKIRPSKSPFRAPLFFVKQNGKLRGMIDYRALNLITKHNNAPIPRTDEMIDRLGKTTYYSNLDLKSGFHLIRVAPEDIEKTAFKTKYCHFEFLVVPVGCRNAPATFQSLMNSTSRDVIDDSLVDYLDDILIYSNNREDHIRHLRLARLALESLKENSLFIGKGKFEPMKKHTEFLGLRIGQNGISVGAERTAVVRDWPKPQTISNLRSFDGLLQFLRRFISKFVETAAPLTNLTRKERRLSHWDSSCDKAFQKAN